MHWYFVHPPLTGLPSGGHRYNAALLTHAGQHGWRLEAISAEPEHSLPMLSDPRLPVLWDSLFAPGLADEMATRAAPQALLVHSVPGLDPALTTEQRDSALRVFDRCVRRLDGLVATGAGMAAWLRGRYAKPVVLGEPGVAELFRARVRRDEAPSARPLIVTVANLLPAKGQLDLLEVLADLADLEWDWCLAGGAPDPDWARQFDARTEALGLTARIKRMGVLDTPQLAELLRRAAILAFPSHYESFGMALAEAAASGVPIVTTDVGEARRIVADGQTGRVVAVGDHPAFGAALAELLRSPERRAALSRNALARPVRSWSSAISELAEGLRRV